MSLEAIANSMPENSSRTPKTPVGNSPMISLNEFPRTRPSTSFTKPRASTANPLRAPNLYCPASPPAPWQTGIAPNQQPMRFMAPTLTDTVVADTWAPLSGKRSVESLQTAMTELRMERGI
uniref:Uncharacterized protein n=1 Tax=Nymphaea colorata TaxID=210225 RepID=A0A5K1E2B0_9MAGN